MKLKIARLRDNAVIPVRATEGSAGMDLSAAVDEETVIRAGETVRIPTGIAAEITQSDYALFIYARSGIASKFSVSPANCVGVVDSDYRGEIIVALHNYSDKDFTVTPGMRIAQMILAPVCLPDIEVYDGAESLSATDRGAGGFGSTGTSGKSIKELTK